MEAAPCLGFPHSRFCSILKDFESAVFIKSWVNHDSLNSIALVPPSLSHPSRAMVDWHSPAEIARDAREVISSSTLMRAIHLVRRRGLQQSHPRSLWPLPVSTYLLETLPVAFTCISTVSAGNSACHSILITGFFPASASFDGRW